MTYNVKNTANVGKSYHADNGKRISFEPGEEKTIETLPPSAEDEEADGWSISREEKSKPDEEDEEGGEDN